MQVPHGTFNVVVRQRPSLMAAEVRGREMAEHAERAARGLAPQFEREHARVDANGQSEAMLQVLVSEADTSFDMDASAPGELGWRGRLDLG